MSTERIMVIGGKESVIVRIFLKKVQDSGFAADFVLPSLPAIESHWKGTTLVTFYLETGDRLPLDAEHFLIDRMTDEGIKAIAIADKPELTRLEAGFPYGLIYKTFTRPLNNDDYIKTANELFSKAAAGEFRKTVLVVDDDPSYLSLVREWLKDTYNVSIVTSGTQALKWLGKNTADLILLDYEMPVTSGPQVLEMLRSDEETQNIPVIFLTGKSDKDSVMSVLAMKPDGYFLKNVKKDELLEKLGKFFTLGKVI